MSQKIKLEPCPYHQKSDSVVLQENFSVLTARIKFRAMCLTCGATGPKRYTRRHAADDWNRVSATARQTLYGEKP